MRGMSLVRHAFLQFKVGSYQLCQKINIPLNENFTSQYRTWRSIRSCWKWKNIRSMGKQTAINIVSGWLIAITVSVCGAGRYDPWFVPLWLAHACCPDGGTVSWSEASGKSIPKCEEIFPIKSDWSGYYPDTHVAGDISDISENERRLGYDPYWQVLQSSGDRTSKVGAWCRKVSGTGLTDW